MRNIPTIFTICLFLFLLGAVVYLTIQNKFSEAIRLKLIPALFIGLTSALFTIWFSLKNENIEKKFISTLFFHKLDKRPLDEHYQILHKFGGPQFDISLRNLIKNHIQQEQDSKKNVDNKDRTKIEEFYHNMVFVKLLSRFFWMYADWWDIRIRSVRRGNSIQSTVSPIEPSPSRDSLDWEDFLETLDKKEDFGSLITSFSESYFIKKMTVPPKTKVKLIKSKYKRTLELTNPFSRVSININKSGGSLGLGDYKWLLGYDNKGSEEFWSEHFEVSCNARFEKTRCLHPEMKIYRRWVETMFTEVQYQLDDEMRLKRARDYRDLIRK